MLNQTELQGISENTDKSPIAGESYYVEYNDDDEEFQESHDWTSRLHLEGNITKFEITELSHLEKFLYEFHAGIKSLNIQSIQPLNKSDYKPQKPEENNQNKDDEFNEMFGNQQEKRDQKEDKNKQLWKEVKSHLEDELLDIRGDVRDIREKTPFILGLKSLLFVLGQRWADSYKE